MNSGLVLFVGIPLPGTGAWTGSLLAALLGMKFKKAFPAVLLGIALASVIMSIVSYGLLGALIHEELETHTGWETGTKRKTCICVLRKG